MITECRCFSFCLRQFLESEKSSNLLRWFAVVCVWCWPIGCCEVDDVEVENKEENKKKHPEHNEKEGEDKDSDWDMESFYEHQKKISNYQTLNVTVDDVGR